MPDALEPDADLAANETEANDGDEVDEDEDECGFADQTAPELLNEVIIRSGYLLKRGDKRKTWKKRWVVLRASRLAFYKNERVINASEIRAVVPVDFKRVGLTVGIVTPDRTMYIRSTNLQETYAWIDAVNHIRALHQDTVGDLAQQVGAVHLRTDARRALRTETAPATSSTREGSAPVTIGTRSSTAPPISILQVCDEMPTPIDTAMLSSSPVSTHMPPSASGELRGREGVRWRDDDMPTRVYPSSGDEESRPAGPSRFLQQPTAPAMLSSSEDEELELDEEHDQAAPLPQPAAPPAREDTDRVIAQGYLMKQSSHRKHWRKRWFVLTQHALFYARSHMDTRVHRRLPMAAILDVMECDASQSGPVAFNLLNLSGAPFHTALESRSPENAHEVRPRKEHCFKIVTPSRTFVVCAPTEEEEIKWLSAFQTILNRQRSVPLALRRASMSAN